jgi:subtilisin family serine protease
MSFAGNDFGGLSNAVAGAYNAGHVLVAGMGNTGANQTFYPAGYSQVIAVAGVFPDKTFATSNPCNPQFPLGATWGNHVDFVAPWEVFTTTFPTPAFYGTFCGTSYATPAVSGTALLVRARYPAWANWQARARLEETAFPLGPPGWDDHFGHGLIRAHLAVAFDPPNVTATVPSGKPKLTWSAIPFATGYQIYRAVTPTACPSWTPWATTTATTCTDFSTAVSSFYGYDVTPSQTAVEYFVVATVVEGGVTTQSKSGRYATFLPNFDPPTC